MAIVIPENYHTFRLLSIDPGLRNIGLAFHTVDARTYKILQVSAQTFQVWKGQLPPEIEIETHNERLLKLLQIRTKLQITLEGFRPNIVSCEGPFYNPLFPDAYGALCAVVSTIQIEVSNYSQTAGFHVFQPQEVKKAVGAAMVRNNPEEAKKAVRNALRTIPEVMVGLTDNLDDLSEHAVDAIAIGYCCLKKVFTS